MPTVPLEPGGDMCQAAAAWTLPKNTTPLPWLSFLCLNSIVQLKMECLTKRGEKILSFGQMAFIFAWRQFF